MNINPSSWHYRVYQGWWQRKQRLAQDMYKTKPWRMPKQPQRLDLCHYCRVVFLFAPWRWFWQGNTGPVADWTKPWSVVSVAGGVAAIGAWAITDPTGLLKVVGVVAVIILLVAFFALLVAHGEKRAQQERDRYERGLDPLPPSPLRQRVSGSLLWQWIKARKQRVCPIITVSASDRKQRPGGST